MEVLSPLVNNALRSQALPTICTRMSAVKGVYKERIVMSNIMKPPPEYSASSVPGSTQQHRKSRRWVWIVLGIFGLLCVLGGALVWTFSVSPVLGPVSRKLL
jgi:hypothetical protein